MQRRRNGARDGHGTIDGMPAAPGVNVNEEKIPGKSRHSGAVSGIRVTDDTGSGELATGSNRAVSATGEPLKNNILAVLVAGLYEHDITNRRLSAPSEGV